MAGRSLLLLALPLEAGFLLLNRLHDLGRSVIAYIAISFAIALFYIFCCWWVTQKRAFAGHRPLAYVLLAGLAFRLTLLPLYPSLSEDAYRYRWEGKLQAAGGNPYVEAPEAPRWARLRDSAWRLVNRKDLTAGYGPVLELTFRWTYAAAARVTPSASGQLRLFKIPFLLFELATSAMVVLLLARLGLPREWVLIYFWSPLPVVEFWANGHNDPLLLFFLVAAVWAACSDRWAWALLALWLAVLTKFWPALLFPLFLWSGGPRRLLPRAAWTLAWTPVAALFCLPYWRGAAALRRVLPGLLAGWRNNASLFNVVYAWAGGDFERAKPVVAALVILAALAIAARRPPIAQGVLWTTAAILFLSANCFPWYLTWLLPLLAVLPNAALLLWTALVPLAYHILIRYHADRQWIEDPFYLWLEYAPVFAMLLAAPALARLRLVRPKASAP
ncbi:MAG TPA: hypothetical protein VEU62_18935 [Bryobacterales bacterium]|nr:hypothetical protein [Bryobacterales bacterium]